MIAIGTSPGIAQLVQVVGRHARTYRMSPRDLRREAKSLKDKKTQLARTIAAYYSIR